MFRSAVVWSLLIATSFQLPAQPPTSSLRLAINDNFADPGFIEVDGIYYAFATGNGRQNIPMATSNDFINWELLNQDALPKLPIWSAGDTWAPDVVQLYDGSFVMYFTARSLRNQTKHCIGTASSKSVTGPYTPMDTEFACPLQDGGAIDPSGFQDADGNRFVTYKVDGNSLGGGGLCGNADGSHSTPIVLQQVSKHDGITLVGGNQTILDRDDTDGPLIEAPSLIRTQEGVYVLFFSSNCYSGPYYDTSYATSTTGVHGPYHKSTKPLLITGGDGRGLQSPGGTTVAPDGKSFVFHNDQKPSDPTVRQMWTGKLDIRGTTVSIAGGP